MKQKWHRFYISDTAYGTKRIWIESKIPLEMIEFFNKNSCWGAFDKSGRNYASWEFDPEKEWEIREYMARYTMYFPAVFDCYERE